jgi:putative oxidoreductase
LPAWLSTDRRPAREYLEKGRNLAERIPYSVIALASRFAVADVFWRFGQTKVNGFSIREETFYLFREEYKVRLLPPEVAAYLSTIGEMSLQSCYSSA